jgi:hypothetical protein
MEGYQKYCTTQCGHRHEIGHTPDAGRGALARDARDEALKQVAREQFMGKGLDFIASLGHGSEVTGEEIRLRCEARGIEPHHHNAWGALIMGAIQKGLLKHTGRYAAMTVKRSHARRTPVYEVL